MLWTSVLHCLSDVHGYHNQLLDDDDDDDATPAATV